MILYQWDGWIRLKPLIFWRLVRILRPGPTLVWLQLCPDNMTWVKGQVLVIISSCHSLHWSHWIGCEAASCPEQYINLSSDNFIHSQRLTCTVKNSSSNNNNNRSSRRRRWFLSWPQSLLWRRSTAPATTPPATLFSFVLTRCSMQRYRKTIFLNFHFEKNHIFQLHYIFSIF